MEVEENQDFLNIRNRRFLCPEHEMFEAHKNLRFLEVVGICNICGKAGKIYTCSLCGNMVCKSCYDTEKGICKSCKRYPGKRI